MTTAAWDLTALLNAADHKATRPDRHLWLVRLVEWLRHGADEREPGETPRPVLRLRHLLNVLERHDEPRARIVALLGRLWRETELAALFADYGFTTQRNLWGEVGERLRLRFLPATPDTDDPATLFRLLFTDDGDSAGKSPASKCESRVPRGDAGSGNYHIRAIVHTLWK